MSEESGVIKLAEDGDKVLVLGNTVMNHSVRNRRNMVSCAAGGLCRSREDTVEL